MRTHRRISAAEFERFKASLEPYRPNGELHLDAIPPCETMVSDAGAYHVDWTGGGRAHASLRLDASCDIQARKAEHEAMSSAPALVGVR